MAERESRKAAVRVGGSGAVDGGAVPVDGGVNGVAIEVSRRFGNLGADGAPVRLGIMGGTFDPIHIGHLACAEQVREAYRLDAVVFVPAGNPAFKQGSGVTPAADRLAMCELACLPNPHFDVSDMEIARGGITYTVDTVRALRAHYPENVELYFISGADSILSIARWRESAAIASMVHFVAATRPGYVVDDGFKAEIAQLGNYDVTYLEVTALAVSSSALRQRVRDGYSARYLTPLEVCDYIQRKGLYREAPSAGVPAGAASSLGAAPAGGAAPVAQAETGRPKTHVEGEGPAAAGGPAEDGHADDGLDASAQDVLGKRFYRARKAELERRVGEKRFRHIEGVSKAAKALAQTYGVDPRKAHLAGLLHDWDKGYDDAGIRCRVAELGLATILDPWLVEHMPQVLHGPTAAAALARDYPAIPADVLQAIERHTTAACDMSPLDMVVYIADAIEPSRKFGRIDQLRALVGQVDLEELFFNTYEYWTLLLLERGRALHPETIAIWNHYAARAAARKGKRL